MASHLDSLSAALEAEFGSRVRRIASLPDEIAIEVDAEQWIAVAVRLRDADGLRFDTLIDVAGVDYLQYGDSEWKTQSATGSGFSRATSRGASALHDTSAHRPGKRFGVVYHLLSVQLNQRLRVRCACPDDDEPMVESVVPVWASANWFEREAFDLYGILFKGHPDLRRILTDYGFVGHPFRKDFPLSGNVEVRYDPVKQRVVYEPVSIEPRTLVPRVIRHDNRYSPELLGEGPVK